MARRAAVWADGRARRRVLSVQVDTQLTTSEPGRIPRLARELEDAGYDGMWTSETAHNPFLPLVAASYSTERMTLGTAVAIAFARNPMTVAYAAWDLQRYARGRFRLGLGSQVRPHIERRFSMQWSSPARRMDEFIRALSTIWRSWETGDPLEFRGEFYQHTLMTPFFTPDVADFGRPPVLLAAVGPAMTRVAAQVADGILLHSFSSADYVRARVLPLIDREISERVSKPTSFEISVRAFVVSGKTSAEVAQATAGVRRQIAFYASTPAYQPILEFHGLADLGAELHRLSRTGDNRRWQAMTDLVPDALVDALTVTGSSKDVASGLLERYGDYANRIRVYTPYAHGGVVERAVAEQLGRSL